MLGLRVVVTGFVDAAQPGWVECVLQDAHGKRHRFVQKAPIVSAAALDAASTYPREGVIRCVEIERAALVRVDTARPDAVSADDGSTTFEVAPDQLLTPD